MYAQVVSGTLSGIGAELIRVEADLAKGLPNFFIVGLPDAAVREARERIRSAIINSGFGFPAKRITVNLSPANMKKEGTHLDLPIAMCLLLAGGLIQSRDIGEYAFIGELSLDGRIKSIKGALPLAVGLKGGGVKKLFLPKENMVGMRDLKEMEYYPVESLAEIADHFNGCKYVDRWEMGEREEEGQEEDDGDFRDIAGQEEIKRALEISAAGGHSLLLMGPPGSGKTMMASRIVSILPPISDKEFLEITQIYSVAERLNSRGEMARKRPFRAPHHTISVAAFAGGGSKPKPGEITLAHNGILFLDELPEFKRNSLEALRQPMENREITINRMSGNVTYPADFLFIGACNPCPCGYYGDPKIPCSCSIGQIKSYRSRLSGPLMDRIDIHVRVHPVDYESMAMGNGDMDVGTDSTYIRRRVEKARHIQEKRFRGQETGLNSQMDYSQIRKYCEIDRETELFLKEAFKKLGLSARAYQKIFKIARTIGDIDDVPRIGITQIAEAIRYRNLDRPLDF
ncbi:MAG: YifB family Mg chelatase-like AAA ATPase [Anaerovoracaceae bacterium]|jgi:magnesium chelatase family protein